MPQLTTPQLYQLAIRHHLSGQLSEAETIYRQILAGSGQKADAFHLLGVICHQSGRGIEALQYLGQAVDANPKCADYYSNLGLALMVAGRWDEAIAAQERAIALAPDHVAAHTNLGLALQGSGQAERAIDSYRRALSVQPDHPEAHYNLAVALAALKQFDSALVSFRRAMSARPGYVEAYIGAANALKEKGQFDAAIMSYREALKLRPNLLEIEYNIANALKDSGRPDQAIAGYHAILLKRPDYFDVRVNLGNAYKAAGLLDDALDCFRAALDLRPDSSAFDNLLLTLNYHPGYGPKEIWEHARAWNETFARPLAAVISRHQNTPDPGRKLRIGYVSHQFRDSHLLEPLLCNHDRSAFEVFCYGEVNEAAPAIARLTAHADVWRHTAGLSDERLSQLIRSDGIDILIDLMMHTSGNRLLAFARKPAPVQVTWLGYPGASGLDAIDYRLSDPYLDPPGGNDQYNSERTIRLPNSFWCYKPPEDGPAVNELPALSRGRITFGCLNNVCKITAATIDLWAKVMAAVPTADLLLLAPEGGFRDRFAVRMNQRSIVPSRIHFIATQPRVDYLRTYHRIDLCLDPIPCPGHTTTLDSLWMGVPVVTLPGATAVSRGGVSILSNLGLHDLIARDQEQYVQIAADLATDLPHLLDMRTTLRERMRNSPLTDGRAFANSFELALKGMWQRWCDSQLDTSRT
jgi:predicted O-linked N-acetylglucosamine transferase (SPINDLY family)